jgi:hypothetical protein
MKSGDGCSAGSSLAARSRRANRALEQAQAFSIGLRACGGCGIERLADLLISETGIFN